jgi:energy-coupling factor transport system permease protein
MIALIPKDSPIHKVDARVKILYLLFILFILITKQSFEILIALSLTTMMLYLLSGIPITQPLKDLGKGWIFVVLPILLHWLINPQVGIYLGVLSSLSLLNMLLISLLNMYTTEIKSILQALIFFKVPSELAFMLAISIRFLPLMQEELNRIRISQALRGYELCPFSLPIPLIVPLLHSSLRRAMELAISLESRGFDPENIHVAVELELGATDYLLLLLLPLLLFLIF